MILLELVFLVLHKNSSVQDLALTVIKLFVVLVKTLMISVLLGVKLNVMNVTRQEVVHPVLMVSI